VYRVSQEIFELQEALEIAEASELDWGSSSGRDFCFLESILPLPTATASPHSNEESVCHSAWRMTVRRCASFWIVLFFSDPFFALHYPPINAANTQITSMATQLHSEYWYCCLTLSVEAGVFKTRQLKCGSLHVCRKALSHLANTEEGVWNCGTPNEWQASRLLATTY
jgi:hypothetical protein